MAEKMEVTRTPDRVAGLEGLSRQLAGVMQFALQRRLQQEKQQQTLDAVRAEQAKEDERLDRKLQADFANLQTKMAQDALQFKEQQETKRKELDILDKTKGYEADIKQLKRLQELEKAENDLRVQNIEKKYLGSKEAQTFNHIQAAKTLYPYQEYTSLAESLMRNEMNFPGSPTYQDPMPYLQEAERLRKMVRVYLLQQGIDIPEENGSVDQGVPELLRRPPEQQQSPFDFMGAGGREMVEPQPQEKTKLEWPE